MTAPAIALRGVAKRYVLFEEQAMLLKSLIPFRTARRGERWALRDIDATVEQGETVGVVGHNGAGKTTLLRLLAGVSQPTSGRITIRGRVAPLIGLGVGFHHEMSGRENVFVNGMLLGLTERQVNERLDEIVAFAELEAFIDTPVKFYSSGMYMRLGFAVASHVDPQILLVDELLAVGDLAFQLKCFDRMRALNDAGTTVVVVSHSMHAIRLLCSRALLLTAGRIEMDGDVEQVIARHEELLAASGLTGDPELDLAAEPDAQPGRVTVLDRALVTADGDETSELRPGVPAVLRARLRFATDVDSPQVHFTVLAADGTIAYQMRSVLNRRHTQYRAGDEAAVEVRFTPHLSGGPFRLLLTVTSVDGRHVLHRDIEGIAATASASAGGGFVDFAAEVAVDAVTC